MRDDGDNRGTLIVSAEASLCHPALAAGLYPGACAAVADRRAEARPLHRGFWVVDAREGALLGFVPLVQGLHAVLGRHTEPHVRVDEQHAGVSLRQALLRVRDDDGTLTLNMLDLESSNGIALHDGRQVRALDASGPFAAALGGLMILFLPEEPGATLPEALPVPELWGVAERDANAGRRRGNGLANARPGAGARAAPERERAHSRIVALEGSRHPSERSFVPPPSTPGRFPAQSDGRRRPVACAPERSPIARR